ncbi:hypothetical protein, partial [Candidatus Frankia alpina]|uniref:hypothetical protein n=1 Tax=Candidatus Frankia alpina TaxID=2699483 RepID=UPI0013867564
AVVVGGTLLATGGTSFAASDYVGRSGGGEEAAFGFGEGDTTAAAERAAKVDAADGCRTKAANGAFADWQVVGSPWSSVVLGECSANVDAGTRLATGGTSFAASDHSDHSGRVGVSVLGFALEKDTAALAEMAAKVDAATHCETKAAKGAFADWQYADGSWSSILNGECSAK